MVTTVTSLGRSGLHDWFVQRLSAVVMTCYAIYMTYFVITTPELGYVEWSALFSGLFFKVFTIITLLMVSLHMWVGLWIVATDYIKPVMLRIIFQALVMVVCLAMILWGALIVWGL